MTSPMVDYASMPAWSSRLRAASLAGLAAAVVAAVATVAVYQAHPDLRLDMVRPLPPGVKGFYPPERHEKTNFAWSRGDVRLEFGHVDRRATWECRADVINWRPPAAGPARVRVHADGSTRLDRSVTEPTAVLAFTIPARPESSDLVAEIHVSPTFRPGPQDPRELGLAFEAISCEPAKGSAPWPAAAVTARNAAASAVAGAVIGLTGLPALAALGVSASVALAQSWSLASGGAAHSLTSPPVFLLLLLFGLFCLLPVAVAAGLRRTPLSAAARLAVVVAACGFYLKLVYLLHPDKAIVDALFHAHRLDWVLAGRFYFTQLSTSATPFPYAIGLYVFSAPWSLLTADHVTLLRIVVCASEAVAGALLYPLILRAWGDRATGVMAVALFQLLPLPLVVVGNANLTAAFGESVGLATMAAATAWSFASRRVLQAAGLTALAALAFLSHVGTFAVLLPTLLALAGLYYIVGDVSIRRNAGPVLAATVLALLLAVGLYYRHFGDVYRPHLEGTRARIGALLGTGEPAITPAASATPRPAGADAPDRAPTWLRLGVRGGFAQTRGSFGWPVIVLSLGGAWSLASRRRIDRLVLALAAWAAVWLGFLAWSAIRTVEPRYVQDAWEFIGRVQLATSPAAAVLAACGALRAWRSGPVLRIASLTLVIAALVGGFQAMRAWIS